MILLLELFTLVFLSFAGSEASICYLVTQPADQGGFECVLVNNSVGGCSVILPGGFRDKMDEPVDDSKCQYCGQNAECILQDHGEYSCLCVPGFVGDGYNCADINECLSIQCHGHATCKNSVGSYECACKQGFVGNGSTCSDVDECEEGHHQCDTNAVCVNTVGSYYCNCSEGYNGTGYKCSDIDECSLSNKCESSPDTKCVNTEGSYFCRCPKGYKLYTSSYTVTPTGIISHLYCKDIDECSKTYNDCSAITHAICINTEGSFVCGCEDGYNRNIIISPDDPNYERITCEDM
ncbi:uncharacterized protein [Apostichopus japonicus]|uniref:uncharacterized protein n=1 Tax=Stichopus japonicus TaxID=307972 RepID=UPI003AB20CA0